MKKTPHDRDKDRSGVFIGSAALPVPVIGPLSKSKSGQPSLAGILKSMIYANSTRAIFFFGTQAT
jgi:hypothetical protein